MIRALSITCLAVGFVLSAIQCLCGMSVQVDVCHVQTATTDCCCAEKDSRVTDVSPVLPPVMAATSPRVSGPDSQAATQLARSQEVLSSRLGREHGSQSVPAHIFPALYLMKTSFLI